MTNQEKIIDKIRKLLAKANGTTNEAEAAVFAAKAREMMIQHQLDQTDVEQDAEGSPEIDVTYVEVKYDTPWARQLCYWLAKYYLCGMYRSRRTGSISAAYVIVGRESRRAVVAEMFEYLQKTVYRLSNVAARVAVDNGVIYESRSQPYKHNFQKGCGSQIAYRLMTLYEKSKKDAPVVDSRLPMIIANSEQEIENYLNNMELEKARRSKQKIGLGYQAGALAGTKVSLNEQISSSGSNANTLLLTR